MSSARWCPLSMVLYTHRPLQNLLSNNISISISVQLILVEFLAAFSKSIKKKKNKQTPAIFIFSVYTFMERICIQKHSVHYSSNETLGKWSISVITWEHWEPLRVDTMGDAALRLATSSSSLSKLRLESAQKSNTQNRSPPVRQRPQRYDTFIISSISVVYKSSVLFSS